MYGTVMRCPVIVATANLVMEKRDHGYISFPSLLLEAIHG